MTGIALPLRIGASGQFARADRTDALLQLVKVMVGTTPGTWPHAPWFGLLPMWESVNLSVDEHPALAQALNEAFRQLGVDWARVDAVRRTPGAAPGQRAFDVTIRVDGALIEHRRLEG